MKQYGCFYSDNPWKFNNVKTGGSMKSGALAKYPVMTVKEMCAMKVPSIAENNSILFLWWVASQPKEAIKVAEAWGFEVKTMTGFIWVKLTEKEKLDFGMGFYTRAGAECCLIATKGKPKVESHSIRSVMLGEFEEVIAAKRREHSQKPDEIRDRVAQMVGGVNKVELFARQRFPTWDAYGNQVKGSIKL